ncbi:MAG: hypothetical protein AAFR61_10390 [Bacteroidota bacterium]
MPSFDYPRFQSLPSRVQQLLHERVQKSGDFSQLRTLHLGDDLATYGQQTRTYLLPQPPEVVWHAYTQAHPAEIWQGPMVNFLFAYSPKHADFFYQTDENMPRFYPGLQLYNWLNIMGPRLIVGIQVMDLDQAQKKLEIAYVEGGLYRGTQILSFRPNGPGTKIEHRSYFRSASRLMDASLYPFFHQMTIGEHHRRMKAHLNQKS